MRDIGPELTVLLEKYLEKFETQVVQPALADLSALERKVIDNFKNDVKGDAAKARPERLAKDLKKIAWVQHRLEERFRKIQKVVENGM